MPELKIHPELAPHYDKWLADTLSSFRRNHRLMTDEESSVLMNCVLAANADRTPPPMLEAAFIYQVLSSRLDSLGAPAGTWAKALLASICRGPGEAVMFAHVFAHYARTHEVTRLEVTDVTKVFAYGYPTEEARHAAWDAQKGYVLGLTATDNMLDRIPSA